MARLVLVAVVVSCSTAAEQTEPAIDPHALDCLAKTIYWEARSEGRRSQLAIAHVALNRVEDPQFPNAVCDVVHQGEEAVIGGCQFSWWCDGASDEPANPVAWKRARALAREVLAGRTTDPTHGALWYHRPSVSPPWAAHLTSTVRIQSHVFYRR